MRAIVCVDMEGVAGIDRPSQCFPSWRRDYREGVGHLTADVRAALDGLRDAGAEAVGLTDWHYMGRNLRASDFPDVAVSRLWRTGAPVIDPAPLPPADVAVLLGMHAGAGEGRGFMSHTFWQGMAVLIDGAPLSEAVLWALAVSAFGTRVVAVAGDAWAGRETERLLPGVPFVATKEGRSRTEALLRRPEEVREELREAVRAATAGPGPGPGLPAFPAVAAVRYLKPGWAARAARRGVGERTGHREVSAKLPSPAELMPWVARALLAAPVSLGPRLDDALYPKDPERGRFRAACLTAATGWIERLVVKAWLREDPGAYPPVGPRT